VTAQPEAEQVGNLLSQIYIEDSRPATDVVHHLEPSQDANLRTVTQAEDEAVQARLISDSDPRNRPMVPSIFGIPRSSPLVTTSKALVTEDMVRFCVIIFRDRASLTIIDQARGIHVPDGPCNKAGCL